MHKLILTLSILSLICIGCSKKDPEQSLVDKEAKAEQQAQKTPESEVNEKKAEEAPSAEAQATNYYAVTEVKIDIKNEAGVFDGSYPSFGIQSIDQDIRKEIDTVVKSVTESFLRTVRGLDEDEPVDLSNIEPLPTGFCEEFGCNGLRVLYEVVQNTKDSIDVYLEFSQYFAGAAHPSSSIHTLMYDTATGKRIDPKSLFKDWNKALQVMSVESRKQIRDELGDVAVEDMLNEGTEPKDENFQNILRTSNSIRIYFEQYAVAPYVAGMQIVNIPMSVFE